MSDGPDYRAALEEMRYPAQDVPRVLAAIENARRGAGYAGFRASLAIANLGLNTRSAYGDAAIEPVIRRIEAQEAVAELDERYRGSTRWAAAARAVADEERRAEERAASEALRTESRLLLAMTEEEHSGAVVLRPEVAELWREVHPDVPLVDGRVPSPRQRQRMEELAEREETRRGFMKYLGLSEAEARAAEEADWRIHHPAPAPAPVPRPVEAARVTETQPVEETPATRDYAAETATALKSAFGLSAESAEAAMSGRPEGPPTAAGALAAYAWERTHGERFASEPSDRTSLVESFMAMGLSEEAAKRAAEGR